MEELDLSAGGFPESTYVGKNTTVKDISMRIEEQCAVYAQRIMDLEREIRNALCASYHAPH